MKTFLKFTQSKNKILFFPDEYCFYNIPVGVYNLLDNDIYNMERKNLKYFSYQEKEIHSAILSKLQSPAPAIDINNFKITGTYIILCHSCNLRCKYCYAAHGTYKDYKHTKMDKKIIKQAIDYLAAQNDQLEYIQFFGGEPLLMTDLIIFAVSYIQELIDNNIFKCKPQLSMVTNLTLPLNTEFLKIYSAYGGHITVSIDGPEIIHDYLRVDEYNSKTFSLIRDQYNILIQSGIIPSIEATYTAHHMKKDITMSELYEYFHQNFSYSKLFIKPVLDCVNNDLSVQNKESFHQLHKQALEFLLNRMVSDDPIFSGDLETLLDYYLQKNINGKNYFICPDAGGITQLIIDTDGSIFPCYALLSRKEMCVGNISNTGQQYIPGKDYVNINKDTKDCKNCWAKYLCGTCLAGDSIRTGGAYGDIDQNLCKKRRAYYEVFIKTIYSIEQDVLKSEKLIQNYYKFYSKEKIYETINCSSKH